MGDLINQFREQTLNLPSLNNRQAIGMMIDEHVPHTYCWSPSLVPKPSDWPDYLDVCGFFFLDLATNYQPPEDLLHFLNAGDSPIYIGFGSITGHDSSRLLKIVLEALKATGYRALLSGLANENDPLPENIFRIGNCPHDWLFQHGNRCSINVSIDLTFFCDCSICCVSPWRCWYNSRWSSCW
jgi:UDP:flavonoid glycosyltransferase YjiC (YdhE family)